MTRKECLDKAAECVLRDRNNAYGGPEDSFGVIANFWSVYLGRKIYPHDVAMMMSLLKIARIRANRGYADGYIDLAGYAACGAECACEKPEAESGCFQNGNDQPEEPKFKPGDAVEWNSVGRGWRPAVYLREFGDFGHCVIQIAGSERIVCKVDLRRPEDNYPDFPDSSTKAKPEFKRGDKVEVQMLPDSSTWASAVITAVYRDKNTSEWRYCVDFDDGWTHVVVPSARVRPVSGIKAEGCEALVEKDAPQTREELYSKILESNPSTFGCAHKPTGEELAEMAEEEDNA